MHDMGITLNGMQLLYLDGSKLTDLTQIVSAKIHQHVVLCNFFFIRKKLLLQCLILLLCPATRPGSCQREGM